MNIEGLSLDQMRVALAVASTGSFSGAARHFRRAQSAISYAITSLENQLGTRLFDRTGVRAKLSAEGQALLAEMAAIVARTDALKRTAQAISLGQEPIVRLVVDSLFDLRSIAPVWAEFGARFQSTGLSIEVETMHEILKLMMDGHAHAGILASLSSAPASLRSTELHPIRLIPVAHRDHPMAQAPEQSDFSEHDHVQIVLGERGAANPDSSFFVFSSRTWRVTDLQAKLALIAAGAGWGYMPEHLVRPLIDAGVLKRVTAGGIPTEDVQPVFVVWSAKSMLGPCTKWLTDRIVLQARGELLAE